jgi:hypothetical protein
MDILSSILGAQGGGATRQLGDQFGLDESQVTSALGALVPALAAGFQNNLSNPQGLEGLTAALAGGNHQQYVDDAGALGSADAVADGNGILGHVFGSKDVSREVASRAAAQTGIGQDVLKSMLPVVASMMMGAMAKRMSQPSAAAAGAGFGGTAAGLGGGGGLLGMLTPMLDSNRDGSIVDDVVGLIGRFSQR